MFLPSKILEVQALKICTRLTAHQVAKFREVALSGPKVICAHTLDFKPIFECSLSKNCWGPRPGEMCASKPWSFSSACNNFRGQQSQGSKYALPKKLILVGPNSVQLCS